MPPPSESLYDPVVFASRPRIIVPVFDSSILELRKQIDDAIDQGADAIELRLDLMDGIRDDDIRQLRDSGALSVPVVLTIRSASEGGGWQGDDTDRVSRLIELGPLADYIDVELALWRRSANVRQKIGLALHRAAHLSQAGGEESIEHAAHRRLILSRHDMTTRPSALHADFVEMLSTEQCDVAKIAWRARSVRDNFEALELIRNSPKPAIVICMGDDGLPSRVLSKKFGAFATFASLEPALQTAAGQASLKQLKTQFRWNTIDSSTRVFGLIADPVSASLSPCVHNAAFEAHGVNAVYVPFRVEPTYESFKAFMVEVLARPWLDIGGFSVTIPHKENALRFVRETDGSVDAAAARIGAVNTLVLNRDGDLHAFNTDCAAAMATVRGLATDAGRELAGLSVAILGAGGMARAMIVGLQDAGAAITLFNRSLERARALAEEFNCQALPWTERIAGRCGLLINCTPLGMTPHDELTPMPVDGLLNHAMVFDTVYTPRRTRLILDAVKRGIPARGGLSMFSAQAAEQFALWMGRTASHGSYERAAYECGAG